LSRNTWRISKRVPRKRDFVHNYGENDDFLAQNRTTNNFVEARARPNRSGVLKLAPPTKRKP
jgi:hypothetical protein